MSLKRKASFSAMPSAPSALAPSQWSIADGSQHLNSRTRKRFRDGRPSDEVVYEKTLRWIFSAQQQQEQQRQLQPEQHQMGTPTGVTDEAMDSEPTLPTPETVDPRQQTLLRFFQPRPQGLSPFRPSRQALAPRANETAIDQENLIRRHAFVNPAGSSSGSETMSPGFNQMHLNMDVDMDTDQSSEMSNSASNVDVMGWT
ncbi:hypothetical protein N7523_001877 [Penicillium sp. IBT 18751x]|nr:hypothetical protein N7523_001877 [Penicillium sp. IBT 18751x]